MITIVVPVYNEAECIKLSHERLLNLFLHTLPLPAEILYINDGSTDGTHEILLDLKDKNPISELKIRVISFSRNFGHSAAVFAGVNASNGDVTAIIDADMQDPPELLPEMINLLNDGWDVVYGRRRKRENETLFKKVTAYFFYRLVNWISGVEIPRDTGDFRVMKKRVVEALKLIKEQDPFVRGLVAWIGFKQFAFEYDRKARIAGSTKYPFRKMLSFAIKAIVSFSNFPLIVAAFIGALGLVGCLILSAWVFWAWSQRITVPGWASLMLAFGMFQSTTLIVIGVVGGYTGRIFQETKNRPRYIISEEF